MKLTREERRASEKLTEAMDYLMTQRLAAGLPVTQNYTDAMELLHRANAAVLDIRKGN